MTVSPDTDAAGPRGPASAAPGSPGAARRDLRFHLLALLALYVLAVGARAVSARHRVVAGHGDVAGYYHVAKNLYAGRGFVQDYVADFLQDPTGVPTPSNTWWLPLPSILAWMGMVVAQSDSYVAAKGAMIAVAALAPLIVYLTALLLLRSRAAALAAGLLAVGFHLYLDQPTSTLSHGPYSVFAAASLLCILAYRRWPKALPWFGLFLGLTYLCRGDSQILMAELALVVLGMRFLAKEPVPIPWKRLAMAAGLFVLVVSPWWVRNQRVLGEWMPSGQKKVTWATNYEDWFTDTSKLTKDRYLAWGWENILDQKVTGVADAIDYTPDVMWRSVVRERFREDVAADPDDPERPILILGAYALTPLMLAGLLILLVRRPWSVGLVLLHLAALAAVYGLIFPAVARESYRSSMFSVMPVALTAVVAPLWLLGGLAARLGLSRRRADALVVGLGLGLGIWNLVAAAPHMAAKADTSAGTIAPYVQFGRWWASGDRPDAVFFVRNPWQFSAETGLRCVMMPNVDADAMLEYAVRFDVQYFLDEGSQGLDLATIRPGAAELIRRKDAIAIDAPITFDLYVLSRGALAECAARMARERAASDVDGGDASPR